jgi:hypothetical protein
MRIVDRTASILEVFVAARPRAVLGAIVFALGVAMILFGWARRLPAFLALGVFFATLGGTSAWSVRDLHHVLDADRGTATVTSRRLFGGGSRRSVTTIHDLGRIVDVELQERPATSRARRRGRAHPTFRLLYRFDDARLEPWSETYEFDRANHEECQAAARAVLQAWRTRHTRSA